MVLMIIDGVLNPNHQTLGKIGNNGLYSICLNYTSMLPNVTICRYKDLLFWYWADWALPSLHHQLLQHGWIPQCAS